jgi:hypothetical protein
MESPSRESEVEKALSSRVTGEGLPKSHNKINTKVPTNFLSLPRKIRQIILAQSYLMTYCYYMRVPELPEVPAPNISQSYAASDIDSVYIKGVTDRATALHRQRQMCANDIKKATAWNNNFNCVHPLVEQSMEHVQDLECIH